MPAPKPSPDEPRRFRPPDLEGAAGAAVPAAEGPPRPARTPPPGTAEPGSAAPPPRPFRPLPFDADAVGPGGPLPALEEGSEGRAAALLATARAEAEAIVANARKEAEGLRDAARQEGLAAGHREGLERLGNAASHLEELARELAGHKSALYEEARAQTVELVLALVAKILGPLGEAEEQAAVRVTERALQLLSDRETLTIRVHPADLKSLVEAKSRFLETFDGIQRLTVLEDPSVRRGGCIVQSPSAEIDARLDNQLQELARAVKGA